LEGKSSYFILLVIVAFLSITLAFLAIGFFFFGDRGSDSDKEVVVVTQEIPSDDELSIKPIFENRNFNLKKTEDKQIAVIVISASMKHYKTVHDMKESDITEKIDFYSNEINEAFGTYFQGLTLDDVSQLDAKKKASDYLTKKINEILTKNEKKTSPLVYSIVFDYWFYQ
jgi:flagellar basal body-associated protein FliL